MLRKIQKYIYLPIQLVCISFPGLVCSVLAQEKAAPAVRPTVDYSPIIAQLKEQLPQQMTQMHVPGLAIALVDGAKLVWAEGFGATDRDSQMKVTADTLFSVQSVSKTYVATGFLIAVEKGLMKIDDPLKKYYPEFTVNSRFGADEADRITFRHLLSHYSGLTHISPCGRRFYDPRCSYVDYIRSISETWLKFPVGERHSYSNLGIDLVAYALGLRSGKPFDEFMNDELFRPLGMTSSAFNNIVTANHPSLAKGHKRDRILPVRPISLNPGGMYSSVKDMAKFISFHLAGGKVGGKRIIGENLLKEMYTQQFPIEGRVYGYGLGIVSGHLRSGTLLAHAGAGAGYRTYHMWTPEYQVGVVVLMNSESGDPQRIAMGVFQQMIEAKYGPDSRTGSAKYTNKPIITLDTKLLQRLAGTYQLREEFLVAFKVKEDGLYVVSGTNEGRLNAHSPTEFSSRGSKFTFILDEKGRPKGVQVLNSVGSDSNVEFLSFNDNPDEAAGPNKKEWQDFVGEYSSKSDGDTFNVNVMIKNGYLYIDSLGGLKLTEYKPGIFFTADGEAVIFQGNRMSKANYRYSKKTTPKVEYKVDAETLKIYEGVYKNEEVEVTFRIKEGMLVGGRVGEELALIPVGKHTFEVDDMSNVTCIFNIEADKIAGLTVKGPSRQMELKKVEAK